MVLSHLHQLHTQVISGQVPEIETDPSISVLMRRVKGPRKYVKLICFDFPECQIYESITSFKSTLLSKTISPQLKKTSLSAATQSAWFLQINAQEHARTKRCGSSRPFRLIVSEFMSSTPSVQIRCKCQFRPSTADDAILRAR